MYHLKYPPIQFEGDWLQGLRGCARRLDLQPGPGGSAMSDFPTTRRMFWDHAGLARAFPSEWTNCRLVGLWPSQQIVAHVDAPIVGQRYHIPIETNSGCWVFSSGEWQQLWVGHVYRMDPTQPHGAVNWGDTVRLHLMIDVEG